MMLLLQRKKSMEIGEQILVQKYKVARDGWSEPLGIKLHTLVFWWWCDPQNSGLNT